MDRWKKLTIFGGIAAAFAGLFFVTRNVQIAPKFPGCRRCKSLSRRGWINALGAHLVADHALGMDAAIAEAKELYVAFLKARRGH